MGTRVRDWLTGLGLSQYADAFETNDIEADLLPRLTDQALKELGVASIGHRLRILDAAARLAAPAPPASVVTARSSPGAIDGERRHATVLLADISGYTALCVRLDAEQVQDLIGRFYDVTDRIVAEYGGHVIDHAGDGTLAVFGAPIAHGNDSERAVKAALAMHSQARTIEDPSGVPIALHVGIASGEVVAATIAAAGQSKYVVTGEAVNLAARINALAQEGQTLLAQPVWNAVSEAVDAAPLGPVQLKGLDQPVAVWRVTGLRHASRQRGALVGRRPQLQQLLELLHATHARGAGTAVLVRGQAGIGKSRLVEEVLQQAEDRGYVCHRGLVLDFGVAKREECVAAVLRQVLQAQPPGDEASLREALEQAVAGGQVIGDEPMFVNEILDLPHAPAQRAAFDAMDNERRAQRIRETFVAIVGRAVSRGPRLVLIEDIHWASPELLKHLVLLARLAARGPLMLLLTSRHEGDPLGGAWQAAGGEQHPITIDLGPLSPEESRELARQLVDSREDIALQCVARSEGNPLFLRQLLRNVAESQSSSIPASIQSLVLARMDRLAPADKNALQAASVLGKRFAIEPLRALLDDARYACDALLDADLLRPEGDGFVFAHALIREGVYASLLNARKRALHRRAAEIYGEGEPLLRCEHLDRAGDPGAAQAYLEAARSQAARFRHEVALKLVERGGELAAENGVRASLLLLRGDLLRDAGRSAESLATFQSALDLAADDDQRYQAWMGIVAGHRVTTEIRAAIAALDEAQHIAERLDSNERRSRVHHVRGNLQFAAGDGDACRREHEAALRHAHAAHHRECEAQALSGLGDAEYLKGRMLTALEHFQGCIELCEQIGLVRMQAANRGMTSHCLYYANQVQESEAQTRRALADAQALGLAQVEIFLQESLGFLLAARGDHAEAEPALAVGIPLARAARARRYLSLMLYALARCLVAQDRRDEARAALEEGLDLARQTGMAFAGPMILSGLAELALDHAEARRVLAQGEVVLGQGAISHSHLHFYHNAIDVSLGWRAWSEALRYAAALESYVREQPLPWATLMIERGRALAAYGSGRGDADTVRRMAAIRSELERAGFRSALPMMDRMLNA